jgi:Flp pilus assembly protein CpaB
MMKNRAIIPLAIGLLVGAVAIKYSLDLSKPSGALGNTDTMTILVARKDIPATAEIEAEMLLVTKSPRTPLIPSDAFSKLDDLIGRVALKSIPQGAPVLPTMIAPKGTEPGLIVRVKEGYRAVAVKIDESTGVGYLVKPGDWVDVLVVMDVKRGQRSRPETISRVIIQRVQVGAVGQDLSDVSEDGKNTHAKSVTLIVKEEDVPKLHLAQTRGKITLAMRGQADVEMTEPAEASESEVFNPHSVGLAKAHHTDKSGFLLGGLLSGLFNAAAKQDPASTPVPVDHTRQVLVINNSASGSEAPDVKRVTYKDASSMDVVAVQEGQDVLNSAHRSNQSSQTEWIRPGPAPRAAGWQEKRVDDSRPSEVSE